MLTKTPRAARPILVDAKTVADMLGGTLQSIVRDHDAGMLPRPIVLGGEERWRVAEIRRWVREGCPLREVWERRWYR